jgi:peroxiredoxin
MLSPRRTAQLGLLATVLVLVSSLGVLIARTIDANRPVARLNRPAPNIQLRDLDGQPLTLADLRGKAEVLYFNSARCPVCNDYAERILDLANQDADDPNVAFLAVESDSDEDDSTDLGELRVQAKVLGQTYPTLLDPRGQVAGLFDAAQTPCFYVIDRNGILRYRGAFDDNRHESQVTRHYVADALHQLLAGQPVAIALTPTPDGDPIL